MNLRLYALIALAAAVIGIGENALFGSDRTGTLKHAVSVGFFLLAVVAVLALITLGVIALSRRMRGRTASR